MTFNTQAATRRTFIIERTGDQYALVKVFEPGHRISQADMQEVLHRVLATEPDERIIAEQTLGITPTPHGPVVQASDAALLRDTMDVTNRILRGERPA